MCEMILSQDDKLHQVFALVIIHFYNLHVSVQFNVIIFRQEL